MAGLSPAGETSGPGEAGALLELTGIDKSFGATRALAGVALAVARGSIHALVGENGAGKSTLGRIVAGAVEPDAGTIRLRGSVVTFRSPRDALRHRVAGISQEITIVPALTVAQNVLLGREPRTGPFVRRRELAARCRDLIDGVGFGLDPDARVGRLRLAERQQVEILRALARDADVLVMDEPTAALSQDEIEHLHGTIRRLASDGRSIILVSHDLDEVLALADTVSVLRDGRLVRTGPAREETVPTLMSAMLGRSIGDLYPERRGTGEGEPVLEVEELVAPGVAGVSFTVRAGEILGVAGLVGAGRTELARALLGAVERTGTVRVRGTDVPGGRPRKAIQAGIAMIPESRRDDGLLLVRPVDENVSIASLPALSRLGMVRRAVERDAVVGELGRVGVEAAPSLPVSALSGGNQQRVVLARATLTRPAILVADEPTRGVDVGARQAIYRLLADLAADGMAILLLSSELEEILGLAHRTLVMRQGRIVARLERDAMTEPAILAAAFGTDTDGGQAA